MKQTESEEKREKAVLAGLSSPCLGDDTADEDTMKELAELVETAGGECVAAVLQKKDTPDPGTFLGEGKVRELKDLTEKMQADMVVFDNRITPSQMDLLTDRIGIQILDREALILDIFAQRARTKEGRLQVELAQYQYLLPRLTGMWGHLVRQNASGGKNPIGTRGPGETQLETDRRHIREKINRLRNELDDVRRVRSVQRARRIRNEMPTVAIVGYTNAGKSTLLNKLTGAEIPARNRLFDTLDTTTRSLKVSDTCTVLISDTVGFIRKLPHNLVDAFKATLEELSYADLLLHVIDASSEHWREEKEVVERLITELGTEHTPRIEVFNKCDIVSGDIRPHGEDIVQISAKTGEGIDRLIRMIALRLDRDPKLVHMTIPYTDGALIDFLHREASVKSVKYSERIEADVVLTAPQRGRLAKYLASESAGQDGGKG